METKPPVAGVTETPAASAKRPARAARLLIVASSVPAPAATKDTDVVGAEEVRGWLGPGRIGAHLFRYREVGFLASRLDALPLPFLTMALVRLLGFGRAYLRDEAGAEREVTPVGLAAGLSALVRDAARRRALVASTRNAAASLLAECRQAPRPRLDLSGTAVYLRADLWYGVRSGGSVAHISGVLNHLDAFAGAARLITTDRVPGVRGNIRTDVVPPVRRYWDFDELPSIAFNGAFADGARALLGRESVAFVYQRYSANSFAGLRLARERGVPFVLEYNGSEVWMSRHWRRRLRWEELSEEIELANLHGADLVVVVSRAMGDELVGRGIDPGKILVNPNGVDPAQYSPAAEGSVVRARLGLEGKTVVGFIGTFGLWHGAEVLAEAFGRLLRERPEHRERVRLLLIGDGVRMPDVRRALGDGGVADLAVLTGLVPQEEGPAHLAACDVLASPHVPNPDGTPFFGSPTKLFEYMAMGKGIVASDLDQIGEVLAHDRTAWMVRPGDPDALAEGLRVLVDDPERRARLGAAAREEAVARYTWKAHTARIVEKLGERCG